MDDRKNYSQHEKELIKRELNEKLYKMYMIQNRQNYTGSIQKYECVINNERGIFKERISMQSKDHIMEQVAYELSLMLGVKCCKASCRKTNGSYGSFSRFEVADMNNVVPFENIANKQEMDTEELLQYTINLTHDSKNEFIINLYQYIIFDYILGQHDRHLENIAIYRKNNNRIVWYPLYDNGLCCFSSYSNDNAIECLDRGFYSSRMGFSEDILEVIQKYRHAIFPNDLRKLIKYNNINYNILMNIIDKSDKYNQIGVKRREATARFIMRQIGDIHNLNINKVGE